jgi:transcriptional regulator GlxA family with amidase domain
LVLNHFTATVGQNQRASSPILGISSGVGTFPSRAAVDPRISRVTALMHRAMHRKLPLRELAGATGLSVSRLCHLFHNQTGMSPRHYLKAARLARAREILETSSLSVKQVAARTGFNHVGRFIGDFRKAYGLTPSHHRRTVLMSELSTEN